MPPAALAVLARQSRDVAVVARIVPPAHVPLTHQQSTSFRLMGSFGSAGGGGAALGVLHDAPALADTSLVRQPVEELQSHSAVAP